MLMREPAEIKYIVYSIDNIAKPKEIVVLKTSEAKEYDEFIEDLPENDCRFAVYDFQYNKGEGDRNKVCFYFW